MYLTRQLTPDLVLIGGLDRRLERFENMFDLPQGVSYNSYIIIDEKTCLLDTVDQSVSGLFGENLQHALSGRPLDYLVVNHVEPDHCSTIHEVMLTYPECKLCISALGLKILKQFQAFIFEERVILVEEGTMLDLGKHKLHFYTAANVHWPEVTMVYEETEGILFSADAFGSFKAPDGHIFSDMVNYERDWLSEERRYYVNIVGRQGGAVVRTLDKFKDLNIRMICPLHGLVFRTPEEIGRQLKLYRHWSTYKAEEAGVVLVYGSMYQNSQLLTDVLAARLADLGVRNIRVYDVSKTNASYIIADLFRFSHAVFCCNNYNTELYPMLDALLRELMMLNFDNHSYSLLGNMSWGGRGLKIAEEILSRGKNLTKIGADFTIKSALTYSDFPAVQALAEEIAEKVKADARDIDA